MPEEALPPADPPPFMTLAEAIAALSAQFRQAGVGTPEQDARLLVLAAGGLSQEDYVLEPRRPLTPDARERICAFRDRRLAREPVSRIIGRRDFWGHSFAIDASTLDPRPETETLVEAVLGIIRAEGRQDQSLQLLDLGTGTGCILLSLLAELPHATGVGVDIDPRALAIASGNAERIGVSGRATFHRGDWTENLSGLFHYIVGNPPYIRQEDISALDPEVSRYDPRLALDGGPDGLDAYRRIAWETLPHAAPDAWLALEAGAGQMPQLIELLTESGWDGHGSSCRVYRDLLGHDRVVAVRKQK
jgi:release factor glutamine methyltransferase